MMPCISWPHNWGNTFSLRADSQLKRPGWFWQMGHLWPTAKMAKTPRLHRPGHHAARPRSMCRAFAAILGNGYCQAPRMLVIFPWFTWAIFNRSVGNCLPNLHICNWFIRVEKCASPNKFLAGVAGLMACGLIALGIRKPLSYTEIA